MIWWHDFIRIIIITNTILAFYIVFHRRRSVSTTWAWLIILLVLPIIGITLYAFFGRGISQENIFAINKQKHIGLKMSKNQLPKHQKKLVLLILLRLATLQSTFLTTKTKRH